MDIVAGDFCRIVKHGDTAIVQLSTRDNAAGDGPDYSEPTKVQLYVVKRAKILNVRGKVHLAGEVVNLTLQNTGWAEYSEAHWCPDYAEFVSENYRMKVLALNGEAVIHEKPIVIMDEVEKMLRQRIKDGLLGKH